MQQWYGWMQKKVKKDEKKIVEEDHQKLVSRVNFSAEGGAGFPAHCHETSSVERRCCRVFEELEDDAETMRRCEEKRIW